MLSAKLIGVNWYGLLAKAVKMPVNMSITICKTAIIAAVVTRGLFDCHILMFLCLSSFSDIRVRAVQNMKWAM